MRRFVCVLGLALAAAPLRAEPRPIVIDGLSSDWDIAAPIAIDQTGDGAAGVDLLRLWIADDPANLYIRFETAAPILLNDANAVTLYLDTDMNSATGLAVGGIGAELEWRFGTRSGNYRLGAVPLNILQSKIRFRAAPTVTANTFEIAIARDSMPDNIHALFTGPSVRILLRDTTGGDQIPQAADTLTYTFDQGALPPETVIPLERQRVRDVRFCAHNVEFDSPWNAGQEPRFGRQLAAVRPDVISLEEVYNHTPQQCADLVSRWITLPAGQSWHAAGNADCKIVSRFPVLASWPLDGNLAALLDTTSVFATPTLVISAHPPCCANDASRQAEIDRIMAFVRDARTPGGLLDLPQDSPIIITGDMNLVGLARQVTTLLSGDIFNEAAFGPDFAPDWDATDLTSLIMRQTERRMAYTWRDDASDFWPGQLDYMIYSDRVLDAGNRFTIYTPEMSAANLTAYNLAATDSQASDHLLLCADFRTPATLAADLNRDGSVNSSDLALLLGGWGLTDQIADLDGDGVVGSSDLGLLLGAWDPRN